MINNEAEEFLELVSGKWVKKAPLTPDDLARLDDLFSRGLIVPDLYQRIKNADMDFALLKDILQEIRQVDKVQPEEFERQRRMLHPEVSLVASGNSVVAMKIGRRIVLVAITAAAAVLIVFGLTIFRHADKTTTTLKPAIAEHDIPPAIKGATLRLADGSMVALDSTDVGGIASQGGNNISKLKGGALAYQSSGRNINQPSFNNIFNTLTTAQGQRYRVDLPDGSKAWLNAASSLTYFARLGSKDSARRVELTGEAYFEIAPMRSVPFIVRANGITTTVLGTRFNVLAYDENPSVAITLLQGAVRVNQGDQSRVLKPGEEAISKAGASGFELNRQADTAMATSWKQGVFEFRAPLGEVMQELARWYDVKIVMQGDPKLMVAARESRELPLSHVLHNLEEIGAGHFGLQDRTIIVKP